MNNTSRRIEKWPNLTCMWIRIGLCKITAYQHSLGERRMAYLLITSFPAEASRVFIDFEEVGMISSRPSCPHAKNLSAGAELGLDD